jgi:hypothetical protein
MPAAAVALSAIALPLILALLGSDFFDGRNMVPVYGPAILVLAAGFTVRRAGVAGLALAALFCLCSLVFTLEIDRLPRLQREDLRNAAHAAGPLRPDSAVVAPRYSASQPLRYYLGAEVARKALPPLREIELIGSASNGARDARRILPPAFHRVLSAPVSYDFTLTVFRSRRPLRVPLSLLAKGALVGGGSSASVLILPTSPASSSSSSSSGGRAEGR